jgi:hypothetical protein
MGVKYLGDYGPDGTCLGRAAADKVGFYGTTPVIRAAVSNTDITTAAITTTTNNYGFADTTQATDLCTIVDQIRTALTNMGLVT